MTRLFNEPAAFADEMIEGFAASHGRWVKRVPGGVVRNTRSTPDTVALVIGGGSGHYPAFAGLVGAGLAALGAGIRPEGRWPQKALDEAKRARGLVDDTELDASDLEQLVAAAISKVSKGTYVHTTQCGAAPSVQIQHTYALLKQAFATFHFDLRVKRRYEELDAL